MGNSGMFLDPPPESEAAGTLFAEALAGDGYVANYLRAWAWRPDVFVGYVDTRGAP